MSGRSVVAMAMAAGPFPALSTSYPAWLKMPHSTATLIGSSSTTSTLPSFCSMLFHSACRRWDAMPCQGPDKKPNQF